MLDGKEEFHSFLFCHCDEEVIVIHETGHRELPIWRICLYSIDFDEIIVRFDIAPAPPMGRKMRKLHSEGSSFFLVG
jgi:hypothetical protein